MEDNTPLATMDCTTFLMHAKLTKELCQLKMKLVLLGDTGLPALTSCYRASFVDSYDR